VSNAHSFAIHEHAHDVEPVGVSRLPVPVNPNTSRSRQLFLLLPVDRFHRISELISPARLDLDESDETLALHDEIDVTMAIPKPSLDDAPPFSPEPPLRDPLSELSERLRGR
jgi:hypothetical protein